MIHSRSMQVVHVRCIHVTFAFPHRVAWYKVKQMHAQTSAIEKVEHGKNKRICMLSSQEKQIGNVKKLRVRSTSSFYLFSLMNERI